MTARPHDIAALERFERSHELVKMRDLEGYILEVLEEVHGDLVRKKDKPRAERLFNEALAHVKTICEIAEGLS